MFSEVNATIIDGNLGKNSSTGTGVQIKIGVGTPVSENPVLITNSMKVDEIKKKLGYTPLADSCIDATENGLKTIYALPMKADVDGEIGEVTKTGENKGTFKVTGKPNNAYDMVVKITETGDTNEGSFAYSIDGGNTFGEDITIPLGGTYVVPGTGLTLSFEDVQTEEKSFIANDAYSFATTSPTMNNASVLKAVERLMTFNMQYELIHVVGVSSKTLWAALQTEADVFMNTYKKPVLFVCEGRGVQEKETLEEYLEAMTAERKGISSRYVCVCLSVASYVRKDLRTQSINMAGVVTGLLGQAKESLSIGCVKQFPVSSAKLLKLLPEGIEEYSQVLDELGYTVFRQYNGLEDFYVSNANVMSPASSDFTYVENVRVLNRLVRGVCQKAAENIQAEVDPNDLEGSVKPMEAELNIPIEDAIRDKIISSGEVTIDTEDVNILVDETLNAHIEYVPMGTTRTFNLDFAVNNPYRSSSEQ